MNIRIGAADFWGPMLKYLGLALTTVLGVAGALWETRERYVDAEGIERERLSKPGYTIVTAIILSFLVGALGVYLEEAQKRADAAVARSERDRLHTLFQKVSSDGALQIASLRRLTDEARRRRYPFSGQLMISAHILLPTDQEDLKPIVQHHSRELERAEPLEVMYRNKHTGDELRQALSPILSRLRLHLSISDKGIYFLRAASTPESVTSREVSVGYRQATSAFEIDVRENLVPEWNKGLSSLLDFNDKLVEVAFITSAGKPTLKVVPVDIALTDKVSGRSLLFIDWTPENNDIFRFSSFHTSTPSDVTPGTRFGWN